MGVEVAGVGQGKIRLTRSLWPGVQGSSEVSCHRTDRSAEGVKVGWEGWVGGLPHQCS